MIERRGTSCSSSLQFSTLISRIDTFLRCVVCSKYSTSNPLMHCNTICILLVVLLLFSVCSAGKPVRKCGLEFFKTTKKACTPPGYNDPCFHGSRKKRHHNLRYKRVHRKRSAGDVTVNDCCSKGCTEEEFMGFCCNTKEWEEHKAALGLL
ncbi:hypothetical protein M3Y95_01018300 [Aphelenchoides besseyi]|nr:hypothetical protein M3Y95_01018300 [Aphelenchoides besseyi]